MNMLSPDHDILADRRADFVVNDEFTFEVGGKKKDFSQIKDISNSFLVLDDIENGAGRKIPLWLFGLLY
ncbi:MAG: hypothetical protein HN580_23690 [Deltaproteobacteria bacterium]|nr:hypothetical protein [Deltaproteobacteria bacterium]MBT4263464.1 hypothetical protein [Deltaproteobacteria bacterium]MBT4642480.1 hypothetical protein [Deltaproteobacteria bacterium]MBT6501926.1 hypothetical protein [Deltaproteobacteria bacterium]MBT6615603.1 hypothetical protein [Deltaproteobacteria bacterium]